MNGCFIFQEWAIDIDIPTYQQDMASGNPVVQAGMDCMGIIDMATVHKEYGGSTDRTLEPDHHDVDHNPKKVLPNHQGCGASSWELKRTIPPLVMVPLLVVVSCFLKFRWRLLLL